jgi:hypothetical protein
VKGVGAAIPLSVTAALLFIDFRLAAALVGFDIFARATTLELFIFVLQLGKTAAAFVVKELREASPGVLVDYYGADLFVLPLLVGAYLFTRDATVLGAFSQVMNGWVIGVAFAALPFAAYKVGGAMFRSGDVSYVVPSGVVATELGLFFASATSSAVGAHGGLTAIVTSALMGHGGGSASDPGFFAALTVIFVSLLLYAVLGWAESSKVAARPALVIAVLATVACAGWIFASSPFSLPLPYVLLPPTLAIVAVSWWIGRAQ